MKPGLPQSRQPQQQAHALHRRFANNPLKVWPALWAFGTQSDDGERLAERALTAAGPCRLQPRSLFTYLTELITAHARGDPFPALA